MVNSGVSRGGVDTEALLKVALTQPRDSHADSLRLALFDLVVGLGDSALKNLLFAVAFLPCALLPFDLLLHVLVLPRSLRCVLGLPYNSFGDLGLESALFAHPFVLVVLSRLVSLLDLGLALLVEALDSLALNLRLVALSLLFGVWLEGAFLQLFSIYHGLGLLSPIVLL